MAIDAAFDASELKKLNQAMLDTAQKQYPQETRKFIQNQGTRLKQILSENYRNQTKRITGNLLRGVNKSSPILYEKNWQVRVRNSAPHAHLIEYGHSVWVNGRKISGKWAPGRGIAGKTSTQYMHIYPEAVDSFVNKLLKDGFRL